MANNNNNQLETPPHAHHLLSSVHGERGDSSLEQLPIVDAVPVGDINSDRDSEGESEEPASEEGSGKFINEHDSVKEDLKKDLDAPEREKRGGRRKIQIEFIENKSRRHVTFSKRKAGLIKKVTTLFKF
jgi:hypothetical protein